MASDAEVAVLASLVELPHAVCTVALARCGGSVDAAIGFLYSQEGLALMRQGGAAAEASSSTIASAAASSSASNLAPVAPASSSASVSASNSASSSASAGDSNSAGPSPRKRIRLVESSDSSSGSHAVEHNVTNSEPVRIPESPPAVMNVDGVGASSQKRKLTDPGQEQKSNSSHSTDIDQKVSDPLSGLPAGWESFVDPSSGKTYYYNDSTNEVSWDRPKGGALEQPGASASQADSSEVREKMICMLHVEGPRKAMSQMSAWHQWCAGGRRIRAENVFSNELDGLIPKEAVVAFPYDVFRIMLSQGAQSPWVANFLDQLVKKRFAIGISAARHLFQAGEQLLPLGQVPDGQRDWTSLASVQAVLESVPPHDPAYPRCLGDRALARIEAKKPTQRCVLEDTKFSMWVSPENELYKTLVGWSSLGPLPTNIRFAWKVVPMRSDLGYTVKFDASWAGGLFRHLPANQQNGLTAFTPANAPLSVLTAIRPSSFPRGDSKGPMSIPCNSSDEGHSQPPGFSKHSLRLEQQQLLQWMVDRENSDMVFPIPAVEASVGAGTVDFCCHVTAVIEKGLPRLQDINKFQMLHDTNAAWGYRFKLEAEFLVRGGILGDSIGFGKTATTIALTNVRRDVSLPPLPKMDVDCFVESRATLILVPSNLVFQWEEEVKKFLGENVKIIVIRHVIDLRSNTFEDVISADIVVCTCRLLASTVYVRQRDEFATKHGNGCLRKATKTLLGLKDWQKEVLLIENVFWARIVIDEFHEVEMMERSQRESLGRMRSHYRWGLTGTPTIENPKGVLRMAGFLGLSWLQQDCPIIAQRFLDLFVRRNAAPKAVMEDIKVRQHVIEVRHTAAERALYLQRVHDRSQNHQEALMLCSHFNPEGESESGGANAKETCCRLRKSKAERAVALTTLAKPLLARFELFLMEARKVKNLIANLSARDATVAALNDCISRSQQQVGSAICNIEKTGPEEVKIAVQTLKAELPKLDRTKLYEAARSVAGEDEFATDERRATIREAMQIFAHRSLHPFEEGLALRALNAQREILAGPKGFLPEYQSAVKSNLFLQAQLQLLDNEGALQQCAFCLDENVSITALAITPCAHVFHRDCLKEAIRTNNLCPMCRCQVLPAQVYSVCEEIKAEKAASSSSSSSASASSSSSSTGSTEEAAAVSFDKYGTKLAKIVETLKRLCEEDASNRVILFCQWKALEKKIDAALREFAVPFLRLSGNAVARGRTLSLFQGERSAERVLLMSLENSASGSNLTAANHVVFVHPMWALSQDKAVAFEMQAIGRIWRHGQRRSEVHVWRFVTRSTIEEEITAKHQGELWKRHLSKQRPPEA